MIKSCNIDKVRLILDSKVILFILPYASTNDVRLRESVLEILFNISQVFPALTSFYFDTQNTTYYNSIVNNTNIEDINPLEINSINNN